MKTKIKSLNIKISYIMLIAFTNMALTSCSKDDKVEEQFSIAFNPNEYEVPFYTSWQSTALEITSNIGNPETINVEANDNVQFDAASGKLSWNAGLPLGTTTATITATKGTNQASTQVAINNIFQGDFSGGYNGTDENDPVNENYDNISFYPDGTFVLTVNTNLHAGTYTVHPQNNKINFSFFSGSTYLYQGVLEYSSTMEPKISGDRYYESVSPANRLGYFEIHWSDQ